MASATVTSKGQITIPAPVRKALHIHTGDRLDFVPVGDGKFEVMAATNDVTKLKGMFKTKKKVSVEDMNKAIKSKAGQ
jgi:AbrB family looped-hinge helix DNA binding protein